MQYAVKKNAVQLMGERSIELGCIFSHAFSADVYLCPDRASCLGEIKC
jgi:hypothetical protein